MFLITDISPERKGTGGDSIYGPTFEGICLLTNLCGTQILCVIHTLTQYLLKCMK